MNGIPWFGQRWASPRFSYDGYFSGAGIEWVATQIRRGTIHPDAVPIRFVRVGDRRACLNNRSLLVLLKAGVRPTKMEDVTGLLPEDGGREKGQRQVERELADIGGNPRPFIFVKRSDGWQYWLDPGLGYDFPRSPFYPGVREIAIFPIEWL